MGLNYGYHLNLKIGNSIYLDFRKKKEKIQAFQLRFANLNFSMWLNMHM